MALASDVMLEAAAMCGDRNQSLYDNAKLLPLLKRASRDLSMALTLDGIPAVEKEHTSTTVAALATEHPNPPSDLSVPIKLWERPDGSTSDLDWVEMTQEDWDPADAQMPELRSWKFQDEKIKFLGATAATKVKMLYNANLAAIVDANTVIPIVNSEHFLAAKTASYAARFIGKNVSLGAELNGDAQQALDLLLGIRIKEDQNVVLRMQPYSMNARRT